MSELLGGLGVFDFARIVAAGVAALSASAWLAARAMKRPPARHLVLTSALGCCLAMPALAAAFLGSGRSLIAVPLLPEMPATAILPRAGAAPVAPPPPLPSPPPSPRGEPLAASTGPRSVVTAAPATSVSDAGSSRPADRPWRRLASAAIVAWGLGSAFLLLRLARSFREVRRIRREARPVDEPALRLLLAEVCRDLGLARLPALVASAEAAAPFAAGLGRPVVVLPERLVAAIGREAMRDVLAHEAAHILKNDHLSILAQELARALYWPIPTIHALARDLARAREALCDNHVLQGRDPLGYGETLLHLAEFSFDAKAPRVAVGILPRQGELERRIAAILDPRRKTMTKNSRSLACLVVLAFLALGAVASGTRFVAARVAGEEPEKKADRSMLVRVLGPDGRPMRGVVVRRSIWLKDPKQTAPKFRGATDEAGSIRIPVPSSVRIFRLWAWSGGHVPLFAHWEEHDDPDGSLPAEFTFRMERGTALGGIVRDEAGEPIPGAAVKVMLDRPPGSDRARVGPDMWLSESATGSVEAAMITDAQGRWALDNAPPGDDAKVLLFVSHPGYQSDDGWGGLQKLNGVDMTSLRDQTATITMRGGVRAVGTVTDPDGKPVAGAVVVRGDRPYFEPGSQEVLTDAAGSFRLPALAAGSTRLTVVAGGWMPETRVVALGPDMSPVNFQLRPGKELRVRFVDRAGARVPDVDVSIRTWRGSEALYNHRHSNVVDTKIPEKSDGEGLYRWTWAPDDAVTYQLSKPGELTQEIVLTAGGIEQTVVVGGRRISGTVVDASTGKPVAGLVAMPVLEFRPGFLYVERRDAKASPDGSYTFRRDRADVAYRVRVEASGYRSAMSPTVALDDPDATFDFRLEPAPPVRGRVLLDGRPAEGSEVFLVTDSQGLVYERGETPRDDTAAVRTDADGRFQFPAGFERYTLVARHHEGYAEATFEVDEQPGDLTLQPWSRVEGRLMQAGRPVATTWVSVEPIRVSVLGKPRIQERYDVETDREGRFAFAKLPPIPASVKPRFSVWRDSPLTSGRSLPLNLQPGGRVEVEIGGRGAMVTGRVVPNGDGRVELPKALNYLVRKGAGIEPSAEVRAVGFDAGKGWDEAWASTPEGMAYLATRDHALVKLDADGRFRVDGLPPGEYDLALRLYEPPDGGCLVSPVGRRVVSFRVEGDGTVDLGDLAVDTVRAPRVGEPAPDLAFNSFDGRAARLADLRGRYVLVDFWASWCAPCAASLPVLRRIHENHGDGRLAILGLSVDEDADAARRFAETNKGAWMQGPADADVRARYAVGAVPAFFLIGPDGRLAHVGLGVEEVEGVLEKLLK